MYSENDIVYFIFRTDNAQFNFNSVSYELRTPNLNMNKKSKFAEKHKLDTK